MFSFYFQIMLYNKLNDTYKNLKINKDTSISSFDLLINKLNRIDLIIGVLISEL